MIVQLLMLSRRLGIVSWILSARK